MNRLFAPCLDYRRLSWWQCLTLLSFRPECSCGGCYWNTRGWPCPRMVKRFRQAVEDGRG